MNTVIYASDKNLEMNPVDILDFSKPVTEFLIGNILKNGVIRTFSNQVVTYRMPFAPLAKNFDDLAEKLNTTALSFAIYIDVQRGNNPRMFIELQGDKLNSKFKKFDKHTRDVIRNQIIESVYKEYRRLA